MEVISTSISERFHSALEAISKESLEKQSKTRHLSRVSDPLEKMVDSSLLREAVAKYLDAYVLPRAPVILFMDRRGGGEGVKISSNLLELISTKYTEAQYIHVSFVTPSGGVGTLLRSALVRKGAECGVLVEVVAHKRPAEGMQLNGDAVDTLMAGCDLVITYAPEGTAGLIFQSDEAHDELLARSHISVLSFPDAEHVVADLPRYEEIIARRPGFNHVRFWVQVKDGDSYSTLGQCTLGSGGDAHERLWVLVDNAKRHVYRVLAEPIARDVAIGLPLVHPCRRLLESNHFFGIVPDKIVQAGSDIVMVAHNAK
ncbi:MAG: hypothetical protein JXX29_09775 [Deltaproteobacteria bacterium]|nr:hypothetical protein [Deltaproteobacteria bacterium]MBN2671954.1 hypothetical protein [Deltaproteobacteria bacterium]